MRALVLPLAAALLACCIYSLTTFEFADDNFQKMSFDADHNLVVYLSQDELYSAPPLRKVSVVWGVWGLQKRSTSLEDPHP